MRWIVDEAKAAEPKQIYQERSKQKQVTENAEEKQKARREKR